MDYVIALPSQLTQHLRSLRKARGLTQAGLAQLLGVVQSRVADIEANPGAVGIEQLMQILSVLGAGVVIRDSSLTFEAPATLTGKATKAAKAGKAVKTDDPPQGQW